MTLDWPPLDPDSAVFGDPQSKIVACGIPGVAVVHVYSSSSTQDLDKRAEMFTGLPG